MKIYYDRIRRCADGTASTIFHSLLRRSLRPCKLEFAMRLVRFFSLRRKQMGARELEIIRKRLEVRSQLKFSCWPTDSRSGTSVYTYVPYPQACKYVNVITGLPRGRHRRSRTIVSMSLAEELRFLVYPRTSRRKRWSFCDPQTLYPFAHAYWCV